LELEMAYSEPLDDIEKMRPPEGEVHSLTAATGGVTAGQVVKLSGDSVGTPSDTDGEETYAVAAQTVAGGELFTALGNGGKVLYTAGETIAAGDALTSHGATGEEGQVATAASGDRIIGYAQESAGSQGDTFVGVVDRGGEVN
jgi:hypothetical protein